MERCHHVDFRHRAARAGQSPGASAFVGRTKGRSRTLLGAAGERLGYDRWLKANTVKTRSHSLFRQGLMLYQHIPHWPEHRLRPLVERFSQMLIEQRVYREIFGVI